MVSKFRLLRPSDVCKILNISTATLYREIKKEGFPKKIRISSQAIGFKESEILDWIESKKEEA